MTVYGRVNDCERDGFDNDISAWVNTIGTNYGRIVSLAIHTVGMNVYLVAQVPCPEGQDDPHCVRHDG